MSAMTAIKLRNDFMAPSFERQTTVTPLHSLLFSAPEVSGGACTAMHAQDALYTASCGC